MEEPITSGWSMQGQLLWNGEISWSNPLQDKYDCYNYLLKYLVSWKQRKWATWMPHQWQLWCLYTDWDMAQRHQQTCCMGQLLISKYQFLKNHYIQQTKQTRRMTGTSVKSSLSVKTLKQGVKKSFEYAVGHLKLIAPHLQSLLSTGPHIQWRIQ